MVWEEVSIPPEREREGGGREEGREGRREGGRDGEPERAQMRELR